MRTELYCLRAEELLSEFAEGTIEGSLRESMEAHLARCNGCRLLLETLREVIEALREEPLAEPPAGLAERVTEVTLLTTVPRPAPHAAFGSAWRVAAGLTLVAAGALMLSGEGGRGVVRAADRLVGQAVNARVLLSERRDRLMGNFESLRVVLGTALEGRVEGVNERVDDYRRLLQRRRSPERQEKKNQSLEGRMGSTRHS